MLNFITETGFLIPSIRYLEITRVYNLDNERCHTGFFIPFPPFSHLHTTRLTFWKTRQEITKNSKKKTTYSIQISSLSVLIPASCSCESIRYGSFLRFRRRLPCRRLFLSAIFRIQKLFSWHCRQSINERRSLPFSNCVQINIT